MINIDPYLQRLEWLKEWIVGIIDGDVFPVLMDISAIPIKTDIEEIMRIYRQTGVLFYRGFFECKSTPLFANFDEYCNYKQSLINNQQ